jgi:hypothetical protein
MCVPERVIMLTNFAYYIQFKNRKTTVPNQFFSISSTILKVLDTIQLFPYELQTDKPFNDLPV